MRHQLEHKASQAALGCMMGFALHFKHCPPGTQGHLGKTVAQVVALQRLVGRLCLGKNMPGFLPHLWSCVLPWKQDAFQQFTLPKTHLALVG